MCPGSPTGGQTIAVDPEFQHDDDDSVVGEEATPSTASISSTILEYRKIHGRTYHNFGSAEYWGPNDETQLQGLDLNHHMLYLALDNKLFLAPLENPQKVLDVGTGTGNWAIDFADEYPSAEVIGIDLAPTQPTWVPPNCKFELDDASKEWTFADDTFDYIHIRWLMGSFEDWVRVYRECYRCLKPGGWLEHMDCSIVMRSDDGSLPENGIWDEWARIFTECSEKTGRTLRIVDDNKFVGWMEEAGFRDVKTSSLKAPIGEWPRDKRMKEIGMFNKLASELGLEGYVLYLLTTFMGWEYAEVQVWLAKVRAALRNRNHHLYAYWGIAWTQKPLSRR